MLSAPQTKGPSIGPRPTSQELLPQPGLDDNKENVSSKIGTKDGSRHILQPRTPGRISLSDLTADPEDLVNQIPSATPNDHVTWKHIPGLMNTPSSIYTTQRGSKRARSSSPGSSQTRKSKHVQDGDNMDMTRLSQSLRRSQDQRSPQQDDPAAVLWQNYAGKCSDEPVLPPLQLIEMSPQTPDRSRKDGSFRRVQSCTNEWPTSSAKRRKIRHHDPHSTTKEIFAAKRKLILKRDQPHHSRVSILLDSLQESISAKKHDQEEPSSSSPLPERYHDPQSFIANPYADEETEVRADSSTKTKNSPRKSPGSPLKHDKSSDFGELDLDDDDLELIEHAFTQHVSQPTRPIGVAIPKLRHADTLDPACIGTAKPDEKHTHDNAHKKLVMSQKPSTACFEDDLDESDLAFDDELLKLADQIPSPRVTRKTTQSPVNVAQPTMPISSLCDGAFDDGFDAATWDEVNSQLIDGESLLTKSIPQKTLRHCAIKRYLVQNVHESTYDVRPGQTRPEKVLSLRDERSGRNVVLLLRQSWYDTRCTKGSYLHLIGTFDAHGQCVVDDNGNMVILHPDHLISATVVGDAISCLRRATLQDRIKATSPPEKPQVYGHILHEVFGEAMKLNNWEMDTFNIIIRRLLPNYLEDLYECEVQLADAEEYLMSRVPLMKAWAQMFVSADFVPDAVLRDRKGAFVPTAINKLLELEEHVWSPMYGLKGNIDATVQAQMQLPGETKAINVVVPLELKTGKRDNVESHRAQTALYTLLLSDRYDVNVTSGILYYLETAKTFRIEGVRHEIRQMIQWRNEVACYVHDKLDLPPMIRREHLCRRCYAQTSCFTYHKLAENGDGESSGMKDVFNNAVDHLNSAHQEFFQKWDTLLTKEERDAMKFKRELWTMLSTEREQVGRCFANVIIEPASAVENTKGPKINRFTYTFKKQKVQLGFSFTESQITIGEPIVISDEKGYFALANGFVTNIKRTSITVAVDRRLQNARQKARDFNEETNQSFSAIMEVSKEGTTLQGLITPSGTTEPILYRIDKDEFSNGLATIRNNLIRLMEKDLFKAARLRQLIIGNQEPVFKVTSTAYELPPTQETRLNPDQRQAISKVMSARDYALVLGMPGTGKTTTIAHIIRALVGQGKSVLLTSYTHTAVDNILLKIKDDNIPVLRLGSLGKIHPMVSQFADLSGVPKTTMEELEHSWSASKVVATTCLSINHGIFNHRVFDYCIVDEASQITLPVCLGPIRYAHTFILVGDHYQLPPLVQNKEAAEGGLDVSLFKLLSDAQPQSVVNLVHQYRMAADIMHLSNELVYSGRLKCGTEEVANRTLAIPNLEAGLEAHHSHPLERESPEPRCQNTSDKCWIRQALSPNSPRALFLNTDSIGAAHEHLRGTRLTNPTESTIITHLLTVLLHSGLSPSSVGIITFYRSQLSHLRHEVRQMLGSTTAAEVEMHTADKFQGRDKEVILLSCVRSNEALLVGELLKDWRRLNVAMTRGRSKLIVVGSKRTLAGSDVPVLRGLVRIMEEKKWMLNLPGYALEGHCFETHAETQTQGMSKAPMLEANESPTRLKGRPKTSQRFPLKTVSENIGMLAESQPTRASKIVHRQPAKIVRGQAPSQDVENLLRKSAVVRDVTNEVMTNDIELFGDGNDWCDDVDMDSFDTLGTDWI